MNSRWSALALLVGLIAGYAVSARPVQAQNDGLPFAVGDTVTLWYATENAPPAFGSSVQCVVAEIRAVYVRCGRSSRVGSASDQTTRWLNTKYVVAVTAREE
jgi:hypothetical protein